MVRSSSGNAFVDVWTTVRALLDAGRCHHYRRYASPLADELAAFTGSRPSTSCLLCCHRATSGEFPRRAYPKSRIGGIGFVDALHSAASQSPTTAVTVAGVHHPATVNGHACTPTSDDVSAPGRTTGSPRYPHVVGYYELDARAKKDCKAGQHYSVDWLRDTLGRITLPATGTRQAAHATGCRIPRSWYLVLRCVTDGKTIARPPSPLAPFVFCDELRTIARNCDVPPSQVQHMLNYFHRRGKLVYFGGSGGTGNSSCGGGGRIGDDDDELLHRLAVIDCSWFVQKLGRLLTTSALRSRCTAAEAVQVLGEPATDAWLRARVSDEPGTNAAGAPGQPDGVLSITGRWMLASLDRLEMCIDMAESCGNGSTPSHQGSSALSSDRLLLIPGLLEYGSPSHDVWPDNPEWEERQITCDFGVRVLRPGLFADLVVRLNSAEGRRQLRIVSDPVPVYLSHHAVFFAAVDQGGCTDCNNARRRMRARQPRFGVAGTALAAPGLDSPDVTDGEDDVLHKVHVMLHTRMDTIRVQVRGVSPCCTMKAVLGFLELYLHDAPDDDEDALSIDAASYSSRTTTSTSGACGANDSPNTSAGGGVGTGVHGPGGLCCGGPAVGGSEASLGSIYPGGPGPCGIDESYSTTGGGDDFRDLFLLCPKCVLLRHAHPGRIAYHCVSPPKRRSAAVCRKWHNLGSWSRATTGDYRFSSVIEVPPSACLTTLPDYEHPRLVVVLPPVQRLSHADWYMFGRTRFLDGFEVHFLCEYTGYWHMTDDVGFWLGTAPQLQRTAQTSSGGSSSGSSGAGKRSGGAGTGTAGSAGVSSQVSVLLNLALSFVQVVHGIPEHANNCRLVAPVVAALLKSYDYLRVVDTHAQPDTYVWLSKNKDRVVTMLTKVLASASDGGMSDLYFRVNSPMNAHTIFHSPSAANRQHLARHLRVDSSSGRFGALRPIYVEREIRWVCDTHYEELRGAPT